MKLLPLAAALFTLTACEDQFVSPSADDSGTDTGTVPDAAMGKESGTIDAGGIPDGAVMVDGAAKGFCLTQSPAPFFCSDWDEGSLTTSYKGGSVGSFWSTGPSSNVTLSLGSMAKSAPASLKADFTGSSSPGAGFLILSDSATPSSVTIDFDIYIESAGSGGPDFAQLVLLSMGLGLAIDTSASPHTLMLPGGSMPIPTSLKVPEAAWTHIQLKAWYVSGSSHSSVAINLMTPQTGPVVPTSVTSFNPFSVSLGMQAFSTSSRWEFDNVIIEKM